MRNEIKLLAIFMAVTLPIKFLAYSFYPEDSFLEQVFSSEEVFNNFEGELVEYTLYNFSVLIFTLLPGILSALWVYKIRSMEVKPKIAWAIMALFIEYFILIFYVAGQIANNNKFNDRPA